jgi:hypothetical protein
LPFFGRPQPDRWLCRKLFGRGGANPAERARQTPGQGQPDHPLAGGTRSVNRELEEKARALAGIKGYITNLPGRADHGIWAESQYLSIHMLIPLT